MKRVLVTGGATGLGLGIAQELAGHGYHVIIVGRREEVLEAVARQHNLDYIAADITQDPEAIIRKASPLLHLVNNAGHHEPARVGHWKADAFRRLYEVHVVAPAMLTQAWAQEAPAGGCVVNMSSTLASRPAPSSAAYSAAKNALVALTRSLAIELAPNLRANALLPGVVPTAMTTTPRDGRSADAFLEAVEQLHPLGLGQPEDVAQAARFLLEAPWITGVALPVDGGLLV